MINCIQLWCQTSGGPLRLGKKAKTLDVHVHFCGFSQHSFIHSFIHSFLLFFLFHLGCNYSPFFCVHSVLLFLVYGLLMFVILISAVKKVEIDMEGQKVLVQSSLSGDELLAALKKTGRECSYIGLK